MTRDRWRKSIYVLSSLVVVCGLQIHAQTVSLRSAFVDNHLYVDTIVRGLDEAITVASELQLNVKSGLKTNDLLRGDAGEIIGAIYPADEADLTINNRITDILFVGAQQTNEYVVRFADEIPNSTEYSGLRFRVGPLWVSAIDQSETGAGQLILEVSLKIDEEKTLLSGITQLNLGLRDIVDPGETSDPGGPTNLVPGFAEDAKIDDVSTTVGVRIDTITLPEATGGDGKITYSIVPSPQNIGLLFFSNTRAFGGRPHRVSPRTLYTYRAVDDDGDAASIEFYIHVKPAAPSNGTTSVQFVTGTVPDNYLYLEATIQAIDGNLSESSRLEINGLRESADSQEGLLRLASNTPLAGTVTGYSGSTQTPIGTVSYLTNTNGTSAFNFVGFGSAADYSSRLVVRIGPLWPQGVGLDGVDMSASLVVNADETISGPIYRLFLPDLQGTIDPNGNPAQPSNSRPVFPPGIEIPDLYFQIGVAIEPVILPAARIGTGDGSHVYSISPSLPPGLEFDSETRTLSGASTINTVYPQAYSYIVSDSDFDDTPSDTSSLPFTVTVTVDEPPRGTVPKFPIGTPKRLIYSWVMGSEIDPIQLPEAVGGDGNLSYILSPNIADYGLIFNSLTKVISGTPDRYIERETFNYIVLDSDNDSREIDQASLELVISIADEVPDVRPYFSSTTSIGDLRFRIDETVGFVFPEAAGGNGRLRYTVEPDPRAIGLTWEPSVRTLYGMPTVIVKKFPFTYIAMDGDSNTAESDSHSLTFTITIDEPFVNLVPEFAPGVTIEDQTFNVGIPVDLTLPLAQGGNGELRYSIAPDLTELRLVFDPISRKIQGTPTQVAEAQSYTYRVVDDDHIVSDTDSDTIDFLITVDPPPNVAPEVQNKIDDQTLTVGISLIVNIGRVFYDANEGDQLTISVSIADPSLATVVLSDDSAFLTFNGIAPGNTTVTVTATDTHGETASTDFALSVETTPEAVGVLPPVVLQLGDEPTEVAFGEAFTDADGDSLSFVLSVNDPTVVATETIGTVVALSPLLVGTTQLLIVASDPAGRSAQQRFDVTVSDANVNERKLTGFTGYARALLGGITDTVGTRLNMDAGEVSIAFDSPYSPNLSFANRQTSNVTGLFSIEEGINYRRGVPQVRSLLTNSNMSFDLVDGSTLGVWLSGSGQNFEGRHFSGSSNLTTIGADLFTDPWLFGISLGQNSAEFDYEYGSVQRTVESSLFIVAPYIRYRTDRLFRAYVIGGFGSGELTEQLREDESVANDASSSFVLGAARRELATWGSLLVSLHTDFGMLNLKADRDEAGRGDMDTAVTRYRGGVEASLPSLGEQSAFFSPYISLNMRNDGGDGDTGSGIEVTGGLRWASGGLKLNIQARSVVSHGVEEFTDSGYSITASFNNSLSSNGTYFQFSARDGEYLPVADFMNHPNRQLHAIAQTKTQRISAELGYGDLVASSRVIMRPFISIDHSARTVIGFGTSIQPRLNSRGLSINLTVRDESMQRSMTGVRVSLQGRLAI